ncbi:MAG TPA: hypothetical protein ENH38_04500 [Nitrospirae bacterium]|nr:hypothetical protein [Nitrospirota bacterium]HDZ87861.1 hypothetical protein [Nitrospirota bacterium]
MRFRSAVIIQLMVLLIMQGFSVECAIGKIIDRVVASVDDTAITKSELDLKYNTLSKINKNISYAETLQGMINRILLLKDAQKYRMEGSEDEIIDYYIDLKIRALVRIEDKDVKKYYEKHRSEFKGHGYKSVQDEIIKYLTELEVNRRLKKIIDKLRSESNINIMLDSPE